MATHSTHRPISILLVEDNAMFAGSVKEYLALVPGVMVVGHALNGPQAISKVLELHPDLILMDITLHGMTGFEIADLVLGLERAPKVIFLSMHDDDAYRAKAKKLGASGFVSKSDFPAALMPILEQFTGP
jgi:DNA-binding NarL/FixJ family response regulator